MSVPASVRALPAYKPPRTLVAGLFDGIELNSEQDARALGIITDATEAQLCVTLRNADGWARVTELQSNRDKALRELLSSDRDRSVFDGHCVELRRRQTELRPSIPNAPIVLRTCIAPDLGGTLEVVFRADGMSDETMEGAAWQVVTSFRGDAEQLGVTRMTAIADILDRRDQFATYLRSVKRAFGRQSDGAWVPLPAP